MQIPLRHFILFSGLILPLLLDAQHNETIRVRSQACYFFQQGRMTDTISAQHNDRFVLHVAPFHRCHTRIEVENGQLYPVSGDTLLQLRRMPNINYTHLFRDSVSYGKAFDKLVKPCQNFTVLVNGAGITENTHLITIRFYDSANDSLVITNRYYYR